MLKLRTIPAASAKDMETKEAVLPLEEALHRGEGTNGQREITRGEVVGVISYKSFSASVRAFRQLIVVDNPRQFTTAEAEVGEATLINTTLMNGPKENYGIRLVKVTESLIAKYPWLTPGVDVK